MTNRFLIPALLTATVLFSLPGRVQAQSCGQFTDVQASDPFCPFILQAFFDNVTQGTGATTFSPNDLLPRNQTVVFFDKVLDQSLHRGTVRTAIGKTWAPTSGAGGIGTDIGVGINDIVSDGTFLWILRSDGKILKVNGADRRPQETWNPLNNVPKRLGIFGGQVWAVDNQGNLQFFNPTNTAGSTAVVGPTGIPAGNFPTLAFDGANIWLGNSSSANLSVVSPATFTGISGTLPANIDGLVFDGTYVWVLLANSTLLKMTGNNTAVSVVETLTLPGGVTDCRMVYDGSNIWIPSGNGTIYVVRPTSVSPASIPSSVVKAEAIPDVAFPYVASYDGENVLIGGVNNGFVALYKASSLTRIRTFNTGANSVRGIASDGRTFTLGDAGGTKFFQF